MPTASLEHVLFCRQFDKKSRCDFTGNAARLQHVPRTPRPCEFMESSREKPLKPYPVGYGDGARQMIWFGDLEPGGGALENPAGASRRRASICQSGCNGPLFN